VLDLSAEVSAHDDTVFLQFVLLLNQDLLAGARNQPAQSTAPSYHLLDERIISAKALIDRSQGT